MVQLIGAGQCRRNNPLRAKNNVFIYKNNINTYENYNWDKKVEVSINEFFLQKNNNAFTNIENKKSET